jgi:hypothetical protein
MKPDYTRPRRRTMLTPFFHTPHAEDDLCGFVGCTPRD